MIRVLFAALLLLTACKSDDRPNKSRPGHINMTDSFSIPKCSNPPKRDDGIHYVTNATDGLLTGVVTLTYEVTGDGSIVPTEGSGPAVTLYFQRRGDDWTAKGKMAVYRWYSKLRIPLTVGEHTITVPLEYAEWGPVVSTEYNTPEYFAKALQNASRVGFVLGGSVGAGHGVCTQTGSIRFTVKSFH